MLASTAYMQVLPEYHRERLALLESLQLVLIKGKYAGQARLLLPDHYVAQVSCRLWYLPSGQRFCCRRYCRRTM